MQEDKVIMAKPIIEISAMATTQGIGIAIRSPKEAVDFFKLDTNKVAELSKPLLDYVEECIKALHNNKTNETNKEELIKKLKK